MNPISLDLARSALDRGKKLFTKPGTITFEPAYSKCRFVADCHPATSGPIFANTTFATDQAADVHAFDYERGSNAASGGFGANTSATQRHTNLASKREAPDNGEVFIVGFEIVADPLKKPAATPTTAAGAADDSDNKVHPVSDNVTGDDARGFLLSILSDVYVPYYQIDDGRKFYPGKLSFARNEALGTHAAMLMIPDGLPWLKNTLLTVGFERKLDRRLPAWIDDFSGVFGFLAQALDLTLDGSIPADGELIALVDLSVQTIGPRTIVGAGA